MLSQMWDENQTLYGLVTNRYLCRPLICNERKHMTTCMADCQKGTMCSQQLHTEETQLVQVQVQRDTDILENENWLMCWLCVCRLWAGVKRVSVMD